MSLKLPSPIRKLIRASSFWQENYLILREFKNFRWVAFSALLLSMIAALTAGSSIGLIGVLLQGLTKPDDPIRTNIAWFDIWILATQASATQRIYRLGGLIVGIIWLQSIFTYLGLFYSRMSALLLSDHLKKSLFEQLQSLSLSFYAKTRAGDLINSVRGETQQVQQALIAASDCVTQGSQLLVYLALMLLLSWQLSIAAILAFSLLSVGISTITARVREASFAVPAANKKFTSTTLEFINGIRAVHASATQDFERQKFNKATQEVLKAGLRVAKLSNLVGPLSQGVSGTMLILIIVGAFTILVEGGTMRATTLLTFLLALSRTMPVVTRLNSASTKLGSFQGSFHSIMDLLSCDGKPYLQDGHLNFKELQQSIDFVSVDFCYNPNELVLHDVTLSIAKGKTTAFVGSSGAGKTTLVDLIPRFFDPSEGKILIDGVDLRELKINSLRRRMAIVSQDTFIFNTSVQDNIAYGLPEIDEKKIWEVINQANALEFIQELPEGIQSRLGDRGVTLSGGQRQRIAIARALLRNPEILILDEATSALDSVTERLIQESLEKLSQGRTVIAIAHRLSTIASADKVIVLEQGRVVEQGNYEELLEQGGELWKYHQMQYNMS